MKKHNLIYYKKKAKTAFQRYVRLRDADKNGWIECCTCAVVCMWNECDGGHFISSAKLSVCFEETNCHAQCKGCNGFGMKYGDASHSYAEFMKSHYGQDTIDMLRRARNKVVKFRIDDYKDMIKVYTDRGEKIKKEKGL